MKNYFIIGTLFILSILIYYLISKKEQKIEIPKVLATKNCFWVGGKDGGYWVEVLYFNNQDSIIANLYIEGTGDFFQKNIYVNHNTELIKNYSLIQLNKCTNAVSQNQFQIKLEEKYYTYMNIKQE